MRIIIAGGSGFIGSELIKRFLDDHNEVVLLTRNLDSVHLPQNKLLKIIQWDGKTVGTWSEFVNGADAVINLSGENVAAKRWTSKQKWRLIKSRIEPTRTIVQTISKIEKKPSVLINASAVGYYGNFGSGDVTESQSKGDGFLADLCMRWEHEAMQAENYGVRVVLLRIGVVLDKSGGALKKMLLPFKMFVGGPLGSGKQWFPWIHRDDVLRIILFVLENDSLSGALNVASPAPATMSEFAALLGKATGRPSLIRVPSFALKVGLGEMSEMLLGGRRIIPTKLLDSGFVFQYPNLDDALSKMM